MPLIYLMDDIFKRQVIFLIKFKSLFVWFSSKYFINRNKIGNFLYEALILIRKPIILPTVLLSCRFD